ncbi:hypothetical protein J3R82DRAFT_6112 [Butyriboletus roseoflavus]|nr:hypothetical protein J3R82DRAFT_6112 [Butyriboletus roseoflavus]
MSSLPKFVSGFTVIPVVYRHSTHILYVRAHLSKSKDIIYPEGRTLFLVNIPVDATDREISLFFKFCGTIEQVVYDRNSSHETEAEAEVETEAETSPSPSPSTEEQQPRLKKQRERPEKASPSIVPLPPVPTRTLRKTGSIAHIIFLDPSSLEKALVPPTKSRPLAIF